MYALSFITLVNPAFNSGYIQGIYSITFLSCDDIILNDTFTVNDRLTAQCSINHPVRTSAHTAKYIQ